MAMLTLAGLLFPALSAAQGDYQNFLSQYAAPYQGYMRGGGDNQGSPDYQMYYQKYMKYGAGAGGGFENFVSKYAGNYASKYVPSSDMNMQKSGPVSFAAVNDVAEGNLGLDHP